MSYVEPAKAARLLYRGYSCSEVRTSNRSFGTQFSLVARLEQAERMGNAGQALEANNGNSIEGKENERESQPDISQSGSSNADVSHFEPHLFNRSWRALKEPYGSILGRSEGIHLWVFSPTS